MRAFRTVLAVVLLVGGCTSSFEPPPGEADVNRRALVDLVRGVGAGERIRLGTAWPGDWDRAAVLRPYSDDDDARDILGFDFAYEGASPWTNAEGGWVVVLADGDRATAWFKIPAEEVGLYCVPELVERGADEFTVHRNAEGYVGIGPPDGADRCS